MDFERDPNQGSLKITDLEKSQKKKQSISTAKEKRFLLNELKQIKQ